VAVTVDGSEFATEMYDRLALLRVEESIQLPDAFLIRIDDPHFEVFDAQTFKMGVQVEIAFQGEGQKVTVTKGEVTAISVEQGPGGRHELVLFGLDATHRLHRGPKSRTFNQMTDGDIASQIAGEYGLQTDIDTTREVHDYVVQPGLSDYTFLSARARAIGFDLWVTDQTLFFKESPRAASNPPELEWGENLHKWKVRFSSTERCDEVTVRGWDPVAKTEIVGKATQPERGTTASAAEEIADEGKQAFGQVSRAAGQFPVATQAEADAMAHSLLLRSSGGEVVARGEAAGDPLLAAGSEVEVKGVGKRLTGKYRLTSVEHVYGAGTPYLTRFVCGAKEPTSLIDLVGSGTAAMPGWGSLVLGTVTNVDDPDKLGRAKVKFVDLDNTESQWAFVASPGAGASRGLECPPEVGDTVVVGFEHDDKRRPIVLGGLWNKTDKPPRGDAVKNGEVVARVLRSRNGHVLELLDEDEGSITLAMGDAAPKLVLKKDESVFAGETKTRVEGQEVELSGSGKLTIEASEIVLNAQTKLALGAPQIGIEASGVVEIKGSLIKLN
jgi:phage protein D/phage baseplate assembly protein gpV